MSNNPAANARTLGVASDGQTPLSCLYREVGLAAVANELNLQLNTLEPDVAAAVERGAAALLLAGREPGPDSPPTKRSSWRGRQLSQDAAPGKHGETVPTISDAGCVKTLVGLKS